MLTKYDVLIVGAGIFGITAAIELNNRGYRVAVVDPGPLPDIQATSNDISQAVRLEHGADEAMMIMMERALAGWQRWNSESVEKLYHQTGTLALAQKPITEGSRINDDYQMLLQREHQPIRLTSDDIARRFPTWKGGTFVDGYYCPQGGYARSGQTLAWLIQLAEVEGVTHYVGHTAESLAVTNGRVIGIHTTDGQIFNADHVIVAAGCWTTKLVPELTPVMHVSVHPVFHLKTADATLFTPPHFAVFTADMGQSSWHGFPIHSSEEVFKIAQHTAHQPLQPSPDSHTVNDADIRNLRTFLDTALPSLKEASITYTRRCFTCDTGDGHFWIGNHPAKPGLTVAAGGNSHGFQFAPILGEMVADTVEGLPMAKFKWREIVGAETAV